MQDQTLIQKWTNSGLLQDVKPHLLERAAERLESSQRQHAGGYNRDALERELSLLDREGYFINRTMNSRPHRR